MHLLLHDIHWGHICLFQTPRTPPVLIQSSILALDTAVVCLHYLDTDVYPEDTVYTEGPRSRPGNSPGGTAYSQPDWWSFDTCPGGSRSRCPVPPATGTSQRDTPYICTVRTHPDKSPGDKANILIGLFCFGMFLGHSTCSLIGQFRPGTFPGSRIYRRIFPGRSGRSLVHNPGSWWHTLCCFGLCIVQVHIFLQVGDKIFTHNDLNWELIKKNKHDPSSKHSIMHEKKSQHVKTDYKRYSKMNFCFCKYRTVVLCSVNLKSFTELQFSIAL